MVSGLTNPPAPIDAQRGFAPHSPREPLSPNDQGLLQTLFRNNLDFHLLAAQTARSVAEILDWADQPHIQQRIDSFRRLQAAHAESTLTHYSTAARVGALKDLEQLRAEAAHPIERRRINHLILRYCTQPTPVRAASPTPPTPRAPTSRAHPTPAPSAQPTKTPPAPSPPTSPIPHPTSQISSSLSRPHRLLALAGAPP